VGRSTFLSTRDHDRGGRGDDENAFSRPQMEMGGDGVALGHQDEVDFDAARASSTIDLTSFIRVGTW
jgi:hypothetical protein